MRRTPLWVLVIIVALILIVVLLPCARLYLPLLARPAELGLSLWVVPDARRVALLSNSLTVASTSSLLAVAFGLPVAFAIRSLRGRWRITLAVVSLVPLVIPPFIQAVGWIELLNQGGGPPYSAHGMIRSIGLSEGAAAIVESAWTLALCFFPCVTWASVISLTRRSKELDDDARLHGDEPAVTRHLVLPMMFPSVILGALLVFF